LKLHYAVGEIAKVGAPLVDIQTEGDEEEPSKSDEIKSNEQEPSKKVTTKKADAKPTQPKAQPIPRQEGEEHLVFAAPAVRRVAREHKVDLSLVKGTGPQGRVLKGDVLAFVKGLSSSPSSSPAAPSLSGTHSGWSEF